MWFKQETQHIPQIFADHASLYPIHSTSCDSTWLSPVAIIYEAKVWNYLHQSQSCVYGFDIHQPSSLTHELRMIISAGVIWEVLHLLWDLLFQKEMLAHYAEQMHMFMEKKLSSRSKCLIKWYKKKKASAECCFFYFSFPLSCGLVAGLQYQSQQTIPVESPLRAWQWPCSSSCGLRAQNPAELSITGDRSKNTHRHIARHKKGYPGECNSLCTLEQSTKLKKGKTNKHQVFIRGTVIYPGSKWLLFTRKLQQWSWVYHRCHLLGTTFKIMYEILDNSKFTGNPTHAQSSGWGSWRQKLLLPTAVPLPLSEASSSAEQLIRVMNPRGIRDYLQQKQLIHLLQWQEPFSISHIKIAIGFL